MLHYFTQSVLKKLASCCRTDDMRTFCTQAAPPMCRHFTARHAYLLHPSSTSHVPTFYRRAATKVPSKMQLQLIYYTIISEDKHKTANEPPNPLPPTPYPPRLLAQRWPSSCKTFVPPSSAALGGTIRDLR